MIRVIVQTCDAGMAANVGGSVNEEFRTFDIEAPALEAHLREYVDAKKRGETTYWHRNAVGVELLPEEPKCPI